MSLTAEPANSIRLTSDEIDLEGYRAPLRKMKLIRQGKAVRYLCCRKANLGEPPRRVSALQFEELKPLWRRRHPKGRNDEFGAEK